MPPGSANRPEIAEGTITVHAHNIYRKLGVDNKQGLIELVDDRSKEA